jgi:hypothetical protein
MLVVPSVVRVAGLCTGVVAWGWYWTLVSFHVALLLTAAPALR